MPYTFSWEVVSAPLEEAELEHCQSLIEEDFGDYVNIKVRVRHQLCFTQSRSEQSASISAPFDWFSSHDSLLLPSQEFLENGTLYMQTYFPNAIIPHELIHAMMPNVITYAKAMVQNRRSGFYYGSSHIRLFTLVLDIVIQKLYDEHERDDDITNMIMRESMEEVKMVPASETAIESLKKVNLENGDAIERCSICLTEFDGDEEVSSMPCKHVYHQECLIQWLKTSHVCPLCRYPMPT